MNSVACAVLKGYPRITFLVKTYYRDIPKCADGVDKIFWDIPKLFFSVKLIPKRLKTILGYPKILFPYQTYPKIEWDKLGYPKIKWDIPICSEFLELIPRYRIPDGLFVIIICDIMMGLFVDNTILHVII